VSNSNLAVSLTVSEILPVFPLKNAYCSYPPFNPKFENVSFALNRLNFACLGLKHRAHCLCEVFFSYDLPFINNRLQTTTGKQTDRRQLKYGQLTKNDTVSVWCCASVWLRIVYEILSRLAAI